MKPKKWKPKDWDYFWFFDDRAKIKKDLFLVGYKREVYIRFGNCFRTKKQAIRARNAVKKVLKGLI